MENRPKISVPVSLPGNSQKHPSQPKEEDRTSAKKVDRIVKTPAVQKESAMRKFTRSFFQEDVENVKDYVIFDVIVPEVKNTFLDVFEMMMFGEIRGRRSRGNRSSGGVINNTHTDYRSRSGGARDRAPERRISNVNRRTTHNFDDIVISDRGDAEMVLDALVDLVETYGFVAVGDFYEMVGIANTHADQKYGWSELGKARIEPSRDGYRFKLPPTRVLD